MTYVNAFSFKSERSLPEMLAVLRGLGTWRWYQRDNDRWGEYISASALPDPDWGIVKIFVEPDHYAINIVLESDDAAAQPRFDAALDTIFKVVLPAIEAREITETDTYE
jgi:hypothetical protein